MSDYIDRQAAIKAVYAIRTVDTEYDAALLDRLDVRYVLEALPSADVEPVVRCKDCIDWNSETLGCKRNPSVSPWWEDDFCNYGARRDPEADYEWSEEEQAYIEQGYMDTQVGLPDLYMN